MHKVVEAYNSDPRNVVLDSSKEVNLLAVSA
jgi:hypothetical protein